MMGAFTQEALNRLDSEIESAETALAEAKRRMGDSGGEASWHDNAAFDQAKADVLGAETQLSRLRDLRIGAYVAERTHSGAVEVGSIVTVQYDDGDIETMLVSGKHAIGGARSSVNEDDFDQISTSSPLGAALMGHEVGEAVTYTAPSGDITVTIEAVV